MRDARVALHLALTVIMGWLALLLAWPGETISTSGSCAVISCISGKDAWAMAFWAMAFCAVASVGAIGLSMCNRALRLFSALVLATAHGVVAISFVLGNPASIEAGTYAVLAGLGYYLAWRRTNDGV